MQYFRTNVVPGAFALAMAFGFAACGGTNSTASEETTAQEAAQQTRWTAALLRKLDTALREQVREGQDDRVAVKVHFQRIPEDEVLANLLLSRVGNQVVGQVDPAVLREIAAREDVDRIEQLTDVGY